MSAGARERIEELQRLEPEEPMEIGAYLDLLGRRAAFTAGVVIDVGAADEDVETRCRRALDSLMTAGWVRVGLTRPRRPRPAATRPTS